MPQGFHTWGGGNSNIHPEIPSAEVGSWGINSTELSSCPAHTLSLLWGPEKAIREKVKDAYNKKLLAWVQGHSGL